MHEAEVIRLEAAVRSAGAISRRQAAQTPGFQGAGDRGANFRVGHEIRARYRSMDVRIFFTTDRARFGTVRRALIRALEHRAYPLPF